jgi:hypothetical protein
MTGYTVHTGSSKKFASGWDHVFQSGRGKRAASKNEMAVQPTQAAKTTQAKPKTKAASKK